MIKKLLSSLGIAAACLVASLSANAQCTPDTQYTTPGVYPPNFGTECVGTPVDQVLQVVIPANASQIPDLDISIPADVDSVIIKSIENVPAGMDDPKCATADCKVIITDPSKPVNTCLHFTGTPTEEFKGNIVINIEIYAGFLGLLTQKHEIPFEVLAENKCVTSLVNATTENSVSIYPNPSSGISTINLNVEDNSEVSATVYNAIGNVSANVFSGTTSSTSLTIPALAQGIYFVQVIINGEATVEKLIIE